MIIIDKQIIGTYVGKTHNTLELNGKKYDAVTGRLLDDSPVSVRTSNAPLYTQPDLKKTMTNARLQSHKYKGAFDVHSKSQKSKTLMRSATKKPSHAANKATDNNSSIITPSHRFTMDVARAKRATSNPKSSHVAHFGPAHSRINDNEHPRKQEERPENKANQHFKLATQLEPASKTPNPFEEALKFASAHTAEPLPKNKLRSRLAKKLKLSAKALSLISVLFAGLILAGFYTYQNAPNLAYRLASSRSGVPSNLPSYKPAGFSLKMPIIYSPGSVKLTYHSNSDSRQYSLTQQKSDWSSEALLTSFVETDGKNFQRYQDKGRTVFIYDNSNITWVSGGVWFLVEGSSDLNSDQLLRIASSL